MHDGALSSQSRVAWKVWDRSTRAFHWINLACVVALAALGLAILNEKSFGVSADGKVLLKTLHVYVGYVFAANLGWRLVWAFVGNRHAKWRALLPTGRGFSAELRGYVRGLLRHQGAAYLGHSPAGRLMVTFLLLLLTSQALTGLVLAGTDLYMPPFGSAVAEWVTSGDPDRLANLAPASKDFVDVAAYDEMRRFRSPVATAHLYAFYVLMVAIVLHVLGVVVVELREKNALISAMFTGEKLFSSTPIDAQDPADDVAP
jgi:cytochrome b